MYIKKIIASILFLLGSLLCIKQIAYAETFYEGSFIGYEHIGRTRDDKTIVSHIRFIEDEKGRKVYCIEPFANFIGKESYKEIDQENYSYLNKETLRKVSLIAFYGYGYTGREDDYWYAITQFLIWQTIAPESDIFFKNFTTGLREDNRYLEERNAILRDVESYEKQSNLDSHYTVNFRDSITFELNSNDFEIVDSTYNPTYGYTFNTSLTIENMMNDGFVRYKQKDIIFYPENVMYYNSNNSQDLIRPGNIISATQELDITVLKGHLNIRVEDNKDVYSIDSSFDNVCYEVTDKKEFKRKICTDIDLEYRTEELPYGTYYIKQISTGEGYILDTNEYQVNITHQEREPQINLKNKLIKNNISLTKYYCKESDCQYEENAKLAIYDKEDNLVTTLITDEKGNASYTVGYGSYKVKQLTGLEGYNKINPYTVKVVDMVSNLHKNLYDQFIKVEKPVLLEVPKEESKEEPKEEPKKEPVKPEVPKEEPKEVPKEEPKELEKPKEEEIVLKEPEEPSEIIPEIPDEEPEEEFPFYEEPPQTGIKESFSAYIIYTLFGVFLSFFIKNKRG